MPALGRSSDETEIREPNTKVRSTRCIVAVLLHPENDSCESGGPSGKAPYQTMLRGFVEPFLVTGMGGRSG